MSESKQSQRRALLVLGHSVPQDEALSRAVALTARVSAELHALFIEDEDLLRAAALPIGPRLFRERSNSEPLLAASVIDAWRALSERARQVLEREGVIHNVRVQYEVLRGSRMLPKPTLPFDLTMFAGARVVSAGRGARGSEGDSVKVVYDASAAAERALALGLSLESAAHPLQLWVSQLGAATRAELEQRLRRQLGARVSFRELPGLEPSRDVVLQMLLSAGGGSLLVPADAPLARVVGDLSRDVILPSLVVLTG